MKLTVPDWKLDVRASRRHFRYVLTTVVSALVTMCMTASVVAQSLDCPARWSTDPYTRFFGFSYGVQKVVALPNDDLIVGGGFARAGTTPAHSLAYYESQSASWGELGGGVWMNEPSDDQYVFNVLPLANGDILVGGYFTSVGGLLAAGGIPARSVAIYRVASGEWDAMGGGVGYPWTPSVGGLAELPNGDILISGEFARVGGSGPLGMDGGIPVVNFAKYRPSTGQWFATGGSQYQLGDGAYCMQTLSGNTVLIGSTNLMRYNVATEVLSPVPQPGFSVLQLHGILAIEPLEDGDVLVGGEFRLNKPDGTPTYNVARVNLATGQWSTVGDGVGVQYDYVSALATLHDGSIVAGGTMWYSPIGDAEVPQRLDPVSSSWHPLFPYLNGVFSYFGRVESMAVLATGDLVLGGGILVSQWMPYLQLRDVVRWNLGRCECNSIDFNNDGSVTDPVDIEAFLSLYSEGPCVPATAVCNDIDFNNDGSLFDPCDISSFLLMYSEGPCTACGT